VVFADVQITIRQRVAVLPVLGYWSELFSYWLTPYTKQTLPLIGCS
jgi:hypothetical protein